MYMRSTLLFIASLIFVAQVAAQYQIPPGNMSPGEHTDQTGYSSTMVSGYTYRLGGVKYNHIYGIFDVVGGWLTQFNAGSIPDLWGKSGDNSDYFLFQGTNEIDGDEAIIVFDTVYFNNGSGNLMKISNTRMGEYDEYGDVSGGIIVGGKLYFNNGITTTDRHSPVEGAIVFVNSSFYDGGLSDAQHVDGFVSEVNYPRSDVDSADHGHGGEFTFPVGNGESVYPLKRQGVFVDGYYLLTVGWVDGDPGTTLDPTQGAINLTGSGFLAGGLKSIVPVGFWDWHYLDATEPNPSDPGYIGAEALTEDQTITVSIPNLDGILVGAAASDLRLAGYDIGNNEWIPLGTTGATGLTKGSLLSGVIPGGTTITAIAIGSIQNIILPATFNSFNVTAKACKALLEWETGMEQDNSHFVVERSVNGSDFESIGRVEAAGYSFSTKAYQFTDESPVEGTNYYRIRQVDFNNKSTSSDVKAVRISCGENQAVIKVYPNPARDQVHIQSGKEVAQINLIAANGQTVLKYVPAQTQSGVYILPVYSVPNGIYILQVLNRDGTFDVIKLLKQ